MQTLFEPLLLETPARAALVFGLRWSPLVGSRPDLLARKRARLAGASHYVHGGNRSAAVGCTRLRQPPKACYSAAQLFALAHPDGMAAGLLTLNDGRVWLVAAQDGAVLARTDRIFATAALARDALQELTASYPGLDARVFELATDDLPPQPAAILWRTGSGWNALPPSGKAIGGVLLALSLGYSAPAAWRSWHGGSIAEPDATPLVPARAWNDALVQTAAALPLHAPAVTSRLFTSLRRLPLNRRGWSLRDASCRPGGAAWHCEASYVRAVPGATFAAFSAGLPPSIQPSLKQLDLARMQWRLPQPADRLTLARIPSASATSQGLASALQRIRPAFQEISMSEAAPLPLAAPRDAQGRAVPRPPGLPALRQRALRLQGPLRSFVLFDPAMAPSAWSEVGLTHRAVSQPTVNLSALSAHLQGVIYEQD